MKNKNLKFALVGCGRIAERHSQLLGTNQIPGAKLVSVCDISLHKAKNISKLYNVNFYNDMDKMMQKEDLDVVVVLTPSGLHAMHVINLAKYGKDIMVEKPMALNVYDAEAMIKACEIKKINLFVVLQNRFNIPFIKLQEAHKKNRFGKKILGTVRVRWSRNQKYYNQDKWRGTFSMDGGVITNQASHHIDLLQLIMGDVRSIFAKTTTALLDIEVEDTAAITLKFKNGAIGIIEATTATRPKDLEGSISILGEKGSVVIGGYAVNQLQTWIFDKMKSEDNNVLEKYSVNPPDVYGYGHKAYYDHVVACISKNKPNLVDGYEGRKSIELIEAIYKSAKLGKEVFLDK